MTDFEDSIFKYSPHLAKRLALLGFERGDPLLDAAFAFAVAHGGLLELDFERDPEVSYNPRPARLGLILVNDVGVRDRAVLAAGFLACAGAKALAEIPANDDLAEHRALALRAFSHPRELHAAKADHHAAIDLALALHLDRARHRHQAADSKRDWPGFLKETEQYLNLAHAADHPLYRLLDHWYRRTSDTRSAER